VTCISPKDIKHRFLADVAIVHTQRLALTVVIKINLANTEQSGRKNTAYTVVQVF